VNWTSCYIASDCATTHFQCIWVFLFVTFFFFQDTPLGSWNNLMTMNNLWPSWLSPPAWGTDRLTHMQICTDTLLLYCTEYYAPVCAQSKHTHLVDVQLNFTPTASDNRDCCQRLFLGFSVVQYWTATSTPDLCQKSTADKFIQEAIFLPRNGSVQDTTNPPTLTLSLRWPLWRCIEAYDTIYSQWQSSS